MGYRPGNTARLQGSDRRLLSVGPGYTAVLEHSPCLTLHPHNPPRTAPGQGSRTSKWTCPGFQAACPKEPEAPVTSCSKAHKVPIRVMSSHKIRPSGKPACVPAFMTALPAWCANPGSLSPQALSPGTASRSDFQVNFLDKSEWRCCQLPELRGKM